MAETRPTIRLVIGGIPAGVTREQAPLASPRLDPQSPRIWLRMVF